MDKAVLRQMIWDEQMSDSTEYCYYCGTSRGGRIGCCGENHFGTFADLYKEDQDAIVDALLDDELKEKQ
jgi:hypothetical protein